MSPVKKSAAKHVTHHKSDTTGLPVPQLPDVFDEVAATKTTKPLVVEVDHADIVVNDAHLDATSAQNVSEIVQDTAMPEPPSLSPDLPSPSEPVLPSFFSQEASNVVPVEMPMPAPKESVSVPTPPVSPVIPTMSPQEASVLQQAVPQAFVGDLNEVKDEVKSEKRSVIVTVCIIIGMVCLAAGLVGLYVVMSRSKLQTQSQATPTPVAATPEPTPMATPVATPAPTPDPALKAKLSVNVLNGTKTKGFAAKEAALVKAAGFKIGTVGNGDPANAGTIVVPTGDTAFGQSIADALPDLKFTISEDAKAKDITVTLGN